MSSTCISRWTMHFQAKTSAMLALSTALASCSSHPTDQRCSPEGLCSQTTACVSDCICRLRDEASCFQSCPVVPWLQSTPNETLDLSLVDRLLSATNAYRSRGGCCGSDCFGPSEPLRIDDSLSLAAQRHADDMRARSYFSHVTPEGASVLDRVLAAGFVGCAVAENLAEGQLTPESAVSNWMASAEHCTSMLQPFHRVVGFGYAATDVPLWVQLVAAP